MSLIFAISRSIEIKPKLFQNKLEKNNPNRTQLQLYIFAVERRN